MRRNITPNLTAVRDRALVREVKARGKARRRADIRALTMDPSMWDDMADVSHDVARVRRYLR